MIRVFVNERPVEVPPGATVRDAVVAAEPELAPRLGHGVTVTDGRGLPLPGDVTLGPGAILRVVVSARRADADA